MKVDSKTSPSPPTKPRQIAQDYGFAVGCVDNSCVWGSPGGMATNGGCRCAEKGTDAIELRRTLRIAVQIISRLAGERDDLRGKLEGQGTGLTALTMILGHPEEGLIDAVRGLIIQRDSAREDRAGWDKAATKMESLMESLVQQREALRAGKCLQVIPGTVIACGEAANYCSQACYFLALLREAHRELATIEAITVSPSDTDGLIDLCRRLGEAIKESDS